MSTASVPKKKPYVGMREYIAYQLEKVRGRLKLAELALVAMSVATLVGGYVFLFVVLDQWVFDGGVPAALRVVASSVVLGAAAVWLLIGVVIPCVKRVNALYAAKQIERADPKLKGTLLSLVDLERAGRPVPPAIVRALERRAAAELAHTDVDEAVDRTALIRVAYALLAVVVLWCVYTVVSPKRIGPSVWRALIPTSPIQPATRTELHRIEPGDAEVIAGTRLPVAVDLRGEVPEEVKLLFTTQDGRFVDEPVVLKEEEPGLKRFVAILQGPNGRGLEQDITYRIVAGDARSREFRVTVLSPPKVSVVEVGYEYPEYMGLSPRTRTSPAIDAWEGTKVTIRAESSTPLKSALLVLSDTEATEGGERIPMRIEGGTRASVTFPLAFRPDGTAPRFYRIECESTAGYRNPQPASYPLNIRRDEPPEVRLLDPSGDLTVAANAVVPLAYAARDPDFRLRSVRLFVTHDGETLRYNPFLYQGDDRRIEGQFDLFVARLGLRPGDRAEFWLQAEDNREPVPNRANTPRRTLTITDLIPTEQKQRELAERRARQAERLEQLREQLEREWGEELPVGEESFAETPASDVASEAAADQPRGEAGAATEHSEPAQPDGSAVDTSSEGTLPGEETSGSQTPDRGSEPSRPQDVDGPRPEGPMPPRSDAEERPTPASRAGDGDAAAKRPRFANDGSDDQRILEELLREQLAQRSRGNGGAAGGQGQSGSAGESGRSGGAADRPASGQTGGGAERGVDSESEPGSGDAGANRSAGDSARAVMPPTGREDGSKRAQPTGGQQPGNEQDGASGPQGPRNADAPMGSRGAPEATPSAATSTADGSRRPEPGVSGEQNATPSSKNGTGRADAEKPAEPGSTDSPRGASGQPGSRPKPAAEPAQASGERAAGGEKSGTQSPTGDGMQSSSKREGGGTPRDPKVSQQAGDGGDERSEAAGGRQRTIDGNAAGGERSATRNGDRTGEPKAGGDRSGDAAAPRAGRPAARPGDAQEANGANPGDSGDSGDRSEAPDDRAASDKGVGTQDPGAAPGRAATPQGETGGAPRPPKSAGGSEQSGKSGGSDAQARSARKGTGEKATSRIEPAGMERQADGTASAKTGRPDGAADRNEQRAADRNEAAEAGPKRPRTPGETRPRADTPSLPAGEPCPDGMCRSPGNCPHCGTAGNSTSGQGAGAAASKGGSAGGKSGASAGQSGSASRSGMPAGQGGSAANGTEASGARDGSASRDGSKGPANAARQPGDGGEAGSRPDGQGRDGGEPQAGAADSAEPQKAGGGERPRANEGGQGGSGGQPGAGGSGRKAEGRGASGQTAGRKPGQGGGQPGGGPGGGSGQGASNIGAPPAVGQNGDAAAGDTPAAQPGDAAGGSGQGSGGSSSDAEPANPEFAREATNLVLKRLRDQLERGQVDPHLLQRLGWTEEDLQRFLDRLSRSMAATDEDSPEAQARRRQFEEMLKRVRPDQAQRQRRDTRLDKTQIDTVTTRRVPVPPEYRELYEAYTKRLAKRRRP